MKFLFIISILSSIKYGQCGIIPITGSKAVEPGSKIVIKEKDLIRERETEIFNVWVNPCTGSISTEEKPIEDLPCLDLTNMPNAPTAKPSEQEPIDPPAIVDKILCPGEWCSFDETSEDTVVVNFKYSIETTNSVADPELVIPKVEETLLQKLAESLLAHCMTTDDIQRSFDLTFDPNSGNRNRYSRRNLKRRRRLDTVGLCSVPPDTQIVTESCAPELSALNNCYVIDGSVTVSIEDGDSEADIIKKVQDATEGYMTEDQLLTPENPDVKKVKYLEDGDGDREFDLDDGITSIGDDGSGGGGDNDDGSGGGGGDNDDGSGGGGGDNDDDDGSGGVVGGIPPVSLITDDDPTIGGGNNFPLILGAVGGLLLLLLFGALFKRKKEHVEHASSSSLDAGIGIVPANDSFIAADSKNLGMHASGMDVHECKSAFCPKCYIDRNIMFLAAPPTPRPPTAQEEAAENGWNAPTNSSLGSSSYESSSTTEFAS